MNKKSKTRVRKKATPITEKNTISAVLTQSVIDFSESYSAKRLSKNLRYMLIEFMMQEGATEAYYFQDLLFDMQGIFDLLEVIDSEKKPTR